MIIQPNKGIILFTEVWKCSKIAAGACVTRKENISKCEIRLKFPFVRLSIVFLSAAVIPCGILMSNNNHHTFSRISVGGGVGVGGGQV